ncbi:hypothetical protein JQ554_03500 [Bradyrhizobium diazoefficiens]|nr:hypothetical protein [Bradyrhizobium diazoefficiens]UCF53485.1 MAG: hypothetical protein JSV48_03225 [Bradyrhizobium sp.]MBR0963160.1 hypothetical protein [Bradyrhizobium diazoefficiens]MBR0975974.1 hypothetical protein [Bradyrhizobium diazoefficiens]MBR1006823.1 hypothetical protein [Bradyrhizobium diazoefficiens]MBR1012933.1 hypothetical protein [Bradyrhizobium diazoefficiens]
MVDDFSEIKIGKSTAVFDDKGGLVGAHGADGWRMSFRNDDGVSGKLPVACENGHTGISIEIPAITASFTGPVQVQNPCPLCGGKLSASAGHYVRNEQGVFERIGGMPS